MLYRLRQAEHTAYLVGGSVRDLLLGRRPKDFDIGTSAHPYQVKKLFRNCWIIGRRFRLAHVKFAWMGGAGEGEGHYYRIQGSTFLIEYDNTQNCGNHAHAVWRDFDGDFGLDLLEEHYRAARH